MEPLILNFYTTPCYIWFLTPITLLSTLINTLSIYPFLYETLNVTLYKTEVSVIFVYVKNEVDECGMDSSG